MPGGHMSYIATLASCLLGRLPPSDKFITPNGSSHGADRYFPPDFDTPRIDNYRPATPSDEEWRTWHLNAIEKYSKDGLCIVKEGWQKYGAEKWQSRLDDEYSISVISTMDDMTNLFYCWFNAVDKIPKHVYSRLMEKSKLWPRMWWKVNQKIRLSEMSMCMPLYQIGTAPHTTMPSLRIAAIDVISADFPSLLFDFLNAQGLHPIIDDDILAFHSKFSARQKGNLNRALALANKQRWKPRGKFDQILFDWYDRNLNENMPKNRLKYLENRKNYLRQS